MTFREIDERLLELVDSETGEILDLDAFTNLQMEREQKAEGMALWVMDLEDETDSISKEIERLQKRKEAAERKIKSLKRYLLIVLGSQKLKTDTLTVSFRNTESLEVLDEEAIKKWAAANKNEEVLRYKEPEINKNAIKKLIKDGKTVDGAIITTNIATIIK